jgi:cysteine desulfurase
LLCESLGDPLANPGAVHIDGQAAKSKLERARRTLRKALAPGRVVFTSGATEANNIVLGSLRPESIVLASRLEHPSVVAPVEWAETQGVEVRWIPNDSEGRIDLGWVQSQLKRGDVDLLTLMAANNELGTLNPVDEIAASCLSAGVPLHVDAVQAFGRTSWKPAIGVTSATISAHKLGGPVGIGALWLAKDAEVVPLVRGGHQERGTRPGTENVFWAMGFAAAVNEQTDWSSSAPPRDRFEELLIDELGVELNASSGPRLPNTSNISFPGIVGEELLMALDLAGLACSAGSACTAGSIDISPVLIALGVGDERAASSLRFSFGPEHSLSDANEAAELVISTLRRLRG